MIKFKKSKEDRIEKGVKEKEEMEMLECLNGQRASLSARRPSKPNVSDIARPSLGAVKSPDT